jgi:hypothetical protein
MSSHMLKNGKKRAMFPLRCAGFQNLALIALTRESRRLCVLRAPVLHCRTFLPNIGLVLLCQRTYLNPVMKRYLWTVTECLLMLHPDWDAFHFLILADEKGRLESGVSSGLASASAIGLPPVIAYGTEAQKEKWLPGIITGETRFCLGATEPSGGSDLASLKTTAVKTDDGKYYVVNGHKVRTVISKPVLHVAYCYNYHRNGLRAQWKQRI